MATGVAYLGTGTMVVVDNARSRSGRTIVLPTQVLQTTAGNLRALLDPSWARRRARLNAKSPERSVAAAAGAGPDRAAAARGLARSGACCAGPADGLGCRA